MDCTNLARPPTADTTHTQLRTIGATVTSCLVKGRTIPAMAVVRTTAPNRPTTQKDRRDGTFKYTLRPQNYPTCSCTGKEDTSQQQYVSSVSLREWKLSSSSRVCQPVQLQILKQHILFLLNTLSFWFIYLSKKVLRCSCFPMQDV